ncbi:MAG TPA: TIGR00282 family metallophosphoesterase [Spirochaetota bacterium]|jgi:hypothetical protein|nr:MAG: hypothetical protein BWX91_02417 [Spirochaetes bacterium ADurb.Bin133]HNZ27354.1 TIGR00282 family metallophosphoesterase [Spirochaetota bacterium]HPY87322.1 TIGR00282 family metallophosphoesterase [Spirochaetota bacterium]HQB61209.1 TIGR00282 family metallophosphoesterase [Spirochaetota bacterium]
MINILFLGEIIGINTVKCLKKSLKDIKNEFNINMVIANADGASDGYGLLADTAFQIKNAGVDIITGGDLIYNKKDIKDALNKMGFILRPFNLPAKSVGKGFTTFRINDSISIGVLNLLGRTNFNKIFPNDPFYAADKGIEKLSEQTKIIIVDFHGGTTSEIQSAHWYLKGKVSAVMGTHLRILTTDNRVIDNTAIITGTGYCGGYPSITGLDPETEIKKIKSGQFYYSKIVNENVELQGAIITIDETTGFAQNIEIFKKTI